MKVWLNGDVVPADEAMISPMGGGFMYGYGIFETVKVYRQKIVFMEEHFKRLRWSCKVLEMELKYEDHEIELNCKELVRINEIENGALKIVYAMDHGGYSLLITNSSRVYEKEAYERGFRLCLARSRKNPYSKIVSIKSTNYIENMLERQNAIISGYDESVFLNVNGKLSEGSISNVFFVKDEKIYTPSVDCGILPGIAREKVMLVIKELKMDMISDAFEISLFMDADEIFVTNSLMDIMPVSQVESKKLDMNKNSITRALMDEYKRQYYE